MEESEALLGTTPPEFMFFPIVGAFIVLGCTAWHIYTSRRDGKRLGVGSLVWSAFITAVLIMLTVWCSNQLVDAEELYWIQAVVILTATGSLLTQRERIFRKLDAWDEADLLRRGVGQTARTIRDVCLILVGSEMSRRALEVPWNTSIDKIAPAHVAIELTLIVIVAFITYFLSQRRAIGPAIVFTTCIAVGIIEHFIFEFRRAAILPMDVLALTTAAEVGDQYTYTFNFSKPYPTMNLKCRIACNGKTYLRYKYFNWNKPFDFGLSEDRMQREIRFDELIMMPTPDKPQSAMTICVQNRRHSMTGMFEKQGEGGIEQDRSLVREWNECYLNE